jgi:hypothetical protein
VGGRSIVQGRRGEDVPPEYRGGIGEEGVDHLRSFVAEGGTLVLHGSACAFGIEAFELPVRDVSRDLRREGFYAAGSVVRMDYPDTWGMPPGEGVAFFSSRDPVFEIDGAGEGVDVLARFGEAPILLSGYTERDDLVAGRSTALRVGYGEGSVVLLGYSFHNRAQSHATFPLLFSLLHTPTAGR